MKNKVIVELILDCHHCGNTTGHFLLYEASSVEVGYYESDPKKAENYACTYYLVKCKTCAGISLYYDDEFDEKRGYITKAYLVYPSIIRTSNEIPKEVSKSFSEALKVEKHSPNGFAILIRRTLEQLCEDKKATGKSLKEKIDNLAKMNIIPKTLSEVAHTLRELGNIGAHISSYKIDVGEMRAMRDFTIAMLEFVYVAPAKLDKLRESISLKTGKMNEQKKGL